MSARADVNLQSTPESVELRGSGAVVPLARAMAERIMADRPGSVVAVSSGGIRRGLKSVIVGTAEIAMAHDRIPEDLQKLAQDRGIKLKKIEVFWDALVPVVHPKNKISGLTLKQLRDIYRGAITNWHDVGGKDAEITVLTHPSTTSMYETFKTSVMGDDAVIIPTATLVAYHELEATFESDADAIAYVGHSQVAKLKVKSLAINGVVASPATVQAGSYPIRRVTALYTREPTSPMANKVIEYFLAPDKGQAFVRAQGDTPVVK